MKLSILIPSTPDRLKSTEDLILKIGSKWGLTEWVKNNISPFEIATYSRPMSRIEVIVITDDKQMTIGDKRGRLYNQAKGLYSWQIDSDDDIEPSAIETILMAIEDNPDCVTFQEHCAINGQFFSSNHSIKYDDWGEKQDGFDYVRTPFMKSVIKTEIAKSVPIPHIRYSEDHEWAKALKPHLKTEVHIPEYLYYYQHNSKPEDFQSRYGYI